MLQDLRLAIRATARAKGTTIVLVLSLTLGTGVNAAVFGVLDRLLLRAPAGVESPSSLVDIYTSEFSGAPYGQSSYPDYLSVRFTAISFLSTAAVDDTTVANVRLGETAQAVRISAVSEDFFLVLDVRPRAGRLWMSAAARPDVPEAVISFPLSEHLGGAADVLGKTLTIVDRPHVIVGVTPPRFRGLRVGRECDVWIRMSATSSGRGDRRLSIVARLAPGVTRDAAEDDLRRLSAGLAERYPATNRGRIEDADALE
jgi:putative ABC transport system permease protein